MADNADFKELKNYAAAVDAVAHVAVGAMADLGLHTETQHSAFLVDVLENLAHANSVNCLSQVSALLDVNTQKCRLLSGR